MPSNPAMYFHPDAVESEGKELVGRRSAGQTFLKGFTQHVAGDSLRVLTDGVKGRGAFEKAMRDMGDKRPIDPAFFVDDFTRFGTIFFPVPGFLAAPWRRLRYGSTSCSLVGVTHTVSTRTVIEGLHKVTHEPVEPWDAIICTSRAVHSVVARQFELEAEFARQRYGARRFPLPQLPIIPLGIEADDFKRSDAFRTEARAKFGATDDAIVIMTMGRLTFVEKANMVPLYQVLEQLAQRLGKPVNLWQVGWASREEEAKLHNDGPKTLCPSVKTTTIDGRDPWVRKAIWSGADIFTLPVDNIQETFGIVPVEAMAAGLPVVMPDWDGFRDTVIHGETGFLVPTRMARNGAGTALGRRFADGTDPYLAYLSLTSQMVQIDQGAYLSAFETLANDPDLRARFSANAVAHVRANLDVAPVMKQHKSLAEELTKMRQSAQSSVKAISASAISPIEVDPFDIYAAYPTTALTPMDTVTPLRLLDEEGLKQLDALNSRDLYRRRTTPNATVLKVSAHLHAKGPMQVQKLGEALGMSRYETEPAVLLLAKFGYVSLPTPELRHTTLPSNIK